MTEAIQPLSKRWGIERFENALSIAVLGLMSLLPLAEMAGRAFLDRGVPGSIPLVQHLTLWIALLGAALATRFDRHLALSTVSFLPERVRPAIRILTFGLGATVAAWLGVASLDLVLIERDAGGVVAWGIPLWAALAVMPAGFAVIAGRLIRRSAESFQGRLTAALFLVIPASLALVTKPEETGIPVAAGLVILCATALGMPIFAAIGGAALLLFWHDGTPLNAVPGQTYRLSASPMLPAIPLFALGGYILAEGGAGRRLIRLFTAWVDWAPGGLAVVTACVLAFFTPLTGASGITILSMGGLFLPILVQAGYPEKTSVGLVTVSGSIGLLFFPSLPVILYAYYSNQPIDRLFIGGLLPGVLLVSAVAWWAARQGRLSGATRTPFRAREAAAALWGAKWELLLPLIVLGGFFGGWATLVETAALTVVLSLFIECVVHRTLSVSRDLSRVVVECSTLVGGFMIILGVALSFTHFLVLVDVPTRALGWVQSHIESPLLFLLALNIFLILVGALMDIYSAIIVVVPLVYPMAAAYGIDPTHLGIIFLANMELGYLMPPMGENLFLAGFRFEMPLTRIYRYTLPYVVILFVAVLLITYVPWLTLGPVAWSGR